MRFSAGVRRTGGAGVVLPTPLRSPVPSALRGAAGETAHRHIRVPALSARMRGRPAAVRLGAAAAAAPPRGAALPRCQARGASAGWVRGEEEEENGGGGGRGGGRRRHPAGDWLAAHAAPRRRRVPEPRGGERDCGGREAAHAPHGQRAHTHAHTQGRVTAAAAAATM